MTWVNLNDVYVSNSGGTISGDLKVNGTLTINDKTGNGTTYDVANQISTLRDSVSPSPITFTSTGVLTITAYRSGPIVMVEGAGLMSCSEWAEVSLGSGLPANVTTTAGAPVVCQSDWVKGAYVHVGAHGELVLLSKSTAITGWTFFSYCYLTND